MRATGMVRFRVGNNHILPRIALFHLLIISTGRALRDDPKAPVEWDLLRGGFELKITGIVEHQVDQVKSSFYFYLKQLY
jgi:hypothetical protein